MDLIPSSEGLARILNGVNLGQGLASFALAIAILLYGSPSAMQLIRGRSLSRDWVVRVMGSAAALGSLLFCVRRILLFSTDAKAIIEQPSWSKITILVGCACFFVVMAMSLIYRAERRRAGAGGWVGFSLTLWFILCMVIGAVLAA